MGGQERQVALRRPAAHRRRRQPQPVRRLDHGVADHERVRLRALGARADDDDDHHDHAERWRLMARRRVTAAQARDRRSKKIAIALAGVFLVVCVVQVPKLMKQLRKAPPAPVETSTTTTPSVSASAAPGTSGGVTATTQLAAFSLLPAKNPFQALVAGPTGSGTSGGSSSSASGAKGSPSAPKTSASTPASEKSAGTPASEKTPSSAQKPAKSSVPTVKFSVKPPNAALIKTNGHGEVVAIGGGFPSSQPMFKIVSLAKNKKGKRIGVKITVLGGSFAGGDPTLVLAKGQKVTLADESDGSRYVIEVVRLTTAAPQDRKSVV